MALGQRLFFDTRLSADGTIACSTCHDPARAFTDGKPVSTGIEGRLGQRSAPMLAMAMAGLGLTTHVGAIRTAGIKPLLLGAVLSLWLIGGGMLINTLVSAAFTPGNVY